MPAVVLPALIPDILEVYKAYFQSFTADPMGKIILDIIFPGGYDSPEFRDAHAKGTLAYWHACKTQYTWKCVDTDSGEIIGMILGDVYLKERTEAERAKEGVEWLEGEQRERAEKVLTPLWEMREKLFGGRKYLYCHVIAIDPQNQGRKAGAYLCKWGIDLGEQANMPIYFESSPTTKGLYLKMGFELLEETVVHSKELLGTEEDIVVPLMVKMPSSAKGMSFNQWREAGYPEFSSIPAPKPKATVETVVVPVQNKAVEPIVMEVTPAPVENKAVGVVDVSIAEIVKQHKETTSLSRWRRFLTR